jgi:hypothetical protein
VHHDAPLKVACHPGELALKLRYLKSDEAQKCADKEREAGNECQDESRRHERDDSEEHKKHTGHQEQTAWTQPRD